MTTFDLISDLYLESMDNFTWENKATSLFCIVAGNISRHRNVLFEFLEELSKKYEKVFFIDGMLEHDPHTQDFTESYKSLTAGINKIEDVVFLHEHIVLLKGTTLLATNGWTTFDFTNQNHIDDTIEFLDLNGTMPEHTSNEIFKMAITDQHYMYNSIQTCQTMFDCQQIIVITNTVPLPSFVQHNEDYNNTIKGDTAGNHGIVSCLENDTENKVSTWIFGNYPDDVDFNIGGVRFLNNSGKNKDLDIYYPKILKF